MRSFLKDPGARGMSEEAVFEALCRVQAEASGERGHEASIQRFLQLFESGSPPEEDGEFPDFAKERGEGPWPAPPAEAFGATPHPDGREPLMEALVQTLVSYRGLLERYNRDFDAVFERRARGELEDDEATIQRLRAAQTILVKYPIAAQAAFAALVREGKSFAKTDEGARWKRRLVGSPLLGKARTLFEGLTGGVMTEGGGPLPSAYVHAFLRAMDRELEAVLADVRGVGEPP